MATTRPALIYIPDISGFTKFITETEIDHSTHIIEELLEIIIDSNQTDLQLSEIEGDAVLFYRFGESPSKQEIVQQSEKMFIKFHEHLKLYERDRVCQCGACSTTQDLSLKMVTHYGELSEVRIKDKRKLLGEDMIVAHRLLKNDVNEDEYLLLSQKFLDARTNNDQNDEDWIEIEKGISNYDEIGAVEYSYTKLSPLHKKVKTPDPRELPARSGNPLVMEVVANVPIKWLYEVMSNADYKTLISGIKIVKDNAIAKVGSKHECILPQGTLHFTTIEAQTAEGRLTYGESVSSFPVLGEVNIINILERINENKTALRIEIHYFPKSWIDKLKFSFFKVLSQKKLKEGIVKAVEFAENTTPTY